MEQRLPELNPQPDPDDQDALLSSSKKPVDSVQSGSAPTEEDAFDAGEYVRQLIARMETDDGPMAPAIPSRSTESIPSAMAQLPPPKVTASPVTPLPLADAPRSLSEIAGENGSPIKRNGARLGDGYRHSVDLQKLREAANITTNGALHAFDCKSLVRRAYYQLAAAIGGMLISLLLLSMSDEIRSWAYESSVILLVVAAIATLRFVVTSRVLNVKLRPSR